MRLKQNQSLMWWRGASDAVYKGLSPPCEARDFGSHPPARETEGAAGVPFRIRRGSGTSHANGKRV